MKHLALIVCLLFITGMARKRTDPRVAIPYNTPSVVKIIGDVEDDEGGSTRYALCTGFVYGYNKVMTARHCVNAKDLAIEFQNGVSSKCEVKSKGKQMPVEDWAILECNTYGMKRLKIASKWPTLPYTTYYTSYRRGKLRVIPISLEYYIGEDGHITMQYTGVSLGGDSGSPIYNADGEVIGLVTRSMAPYEPTGLAVPFLYLPGN